MGTHGNQCDPMEFPGAHHSSSTIAILAVPSPCVLVVEWFLPFRRSARVGSAPSWRMLACGGRLRLGVLVNGVVGGCLLRCQPRVADTLFCVVHWGESAFFGIMRQLLLAIFSACFPWRGKGRIANWDAVYESSFPSKFVQQMARGARCGVVFGNQGPPIASHPQDVWL